MSVSYIGYDIFPSIALHYTTQDRNIFCRSLFQMCTNYSFSSSLSLLRFIIIINRSINRSQTFFNAFISYILFWYTMSTLLTKMLNQFLYFLQFSDISFVFFCKIEHRAEHQGNLHLIKTAPKQSRWVSYQSLVFHKAFVLRLIISPMLIV